jgi:hypothetical protein
LERRIREGDSTNEKGTIMANIYAKSMREALQEARDYRDTSDIEVKNEAVKGWKGTWFSAMFGDPKYPWTQQQHKDPNTFDIMRASALAYLFGTKQEVATLWVIKNGNAANEHKSYIKSIMRKYASKVSKLPKTNSASWKEELDIEEGKGFLEYDEWLKQEKGIAKGAYGVNSDEHAKYSAEWRAYVKGLFGKLPPAKTEESDLEEIVGGHGDMTITKDGGVMIIKSKDWQTYKAKGWAKKTNESLDLPATGDTITSKASQVDEGKELNKSLSSGKSGYPELTEAL